MVIYLEQKPLWAFSQSMKRWLGIAFSFFLQHNLPLGLLIGVIFGALVPQPGQWLGGLPIAINSLSVFIIFIVQGLKLSTSEVKEALSSGRACLFGAISILFITSLLALVLVAIPYSSPDFAIGFGMFAVMPTTISGGIVLTREAGGHVPLSVLLTLSSNLAAIFTVPLLLPTFVLNRLSSTVDTISVDVSGTSLLLNLILDILLPLGIGKAIRDYVPNSLVYIKKTDAATKYLANFCLILLPLVQISESHSQVASLSFASILIVMLIGFTMHTFYLMFNFGSTYIFYDAIFLDVAKHKSMVIMCSQKSVGIAVAVLTQLPIDDDRKGIVVVPLVVTHLIQTVLDSIVAGVWKARTSTSFKQLAENENDDSSPTDMPTGEVCNDNSVLDGKDIEVIVSPPPVHLDCELSHEEYLSFSIRQPSFESIKISDKYDDEDDDISEEDYYDDYISSDEENCTIDNSTTTVDTNISTPIL